TQTLIQSPKRDTLAAQNPTTAAPEIDVGGSNHAIDLIASSSVKGLQVPDDPRSLDEFFLDEGLLPVMASRRGDGGDAAGADKVLWPAAALMNLPEAGLWSVIATFLPDRATWQSNPPAYEGWKSSPFKTPNELDDMLKERNVPKISTPARGIDPN